MIFSAKRLQKTYLFPAKALYPENSEALQKILWKLWYKNKFVAIISDV